MGCWDLFFSFSYKANTLNPGCITTPHPTDLIVPLLVSSVCCFDISNIQRYWMIYGFVRHLVFKNEDTHRLGFYCLSGNIMMLRWMWVILICVLFLSMGSIWWCLILMPSMKLPWASTTGTPGQCRIYNYTTTTVQYENTKFKKFHTQTTTNNKKLQVKQQKTQIERRCTHLPKNYKLQLNNQYNNQ